MVEVQTSKYLISMRKMATMREIECHDSLMGFQQCSVNMKICGRPRQRLHVHCNLYGFSDIRRLKQTPNTFNEFIEYQESSWVIISKFNHQSPCQTATSRNLYKSQLIDTFPCMLITRKDKWYNILLKPKI